MVLKTKIPFLRAGVVLFRTKGTRFNESHLICYRILIGYLQLGCFIIDIFQDYLAGSTLGGERVGKRIE
jgi:hypothetical protein